MYKKQCFSKKSLKDLNTFSIDVTAKKIIFIKTIKALIELWKKYKLFQTPYIILGEGSNILFLENYKGIVIINRIKGIKIIEKNNIWFLHVSSGEKWHDLVKYTLRIGIFGLENLALIPGCVGSAAIQNIGAYGLEFQSVCEYVDIFFLKNGATERIYVNFCNFSYRNSIFKSKYYHGCIVIAVGIKLLKKWHPITSYLFFNKIQLIKMTPYKMFNIICNIRKKKLPNPKKIGSAGSFFKNPIITKKILSKLQSLYLNIPVYPQKNGLVKISGAWLIENYQFKNIQIGDADIYKKQKLVLINKKNATAKEVIKLAKKIQICILKKFNIWLKPEIDFIGSTGKIKILKKFNFME